MYDLVMLSFLISALETDFKRHFPSTIIFLMIGYSTTHDLSMLTSQDHLWKEVPPHSKMG